ncbi:hypothetical protein [Aureimonas sp. AU12]|uniref:hypothetical protein n=1 Tax=Aureimonas sp. AU12 TaxID=1638161 RepID=UPI0007826755|nr:hypothetical protein [Aureimonas sp. AU12]
MAWLTENWNVQTVIAVGAVGFTALSTFFTLGNQVERLNEWRVGHDAYHKDRAAELATLEGRTEERFRTVENGLRKIDELGFRVARGEESNNSTKEAIRALETTVNSQGSDIRVIREILERMDGKRSELRRPTQP